MSTQVGTVAFLGKLAKGKIGEEKQAGIRTGESL